MAIQLGGYGKLKIKLHFGPLTSTCLTSLGTLIDVARCIKRHGWVKERIKGDLEWN